MVFNIDWIVPQLRKPPSKLWNIASSITIAVVGLFSKIIIEWLNKTKIYNKHIMENALDSRPANVPLITVSNHHSCFDDPGIWGTLKFRHFTRLKMRWSLAAHDICFTNKWHSYFFMIGKCVPVVRGDGVHQAAVDFCIEQLNRGQWVHVFPEGKVNLTKEDMRIKWGIGRMIYESAVPPIIVPIWHIGMDDVLPNEPPYVLRFGKKLTFNYGKPINMSGLIESLRRRNASDTEARKAITDHIQIELAKLKRETEKLHRLAYET